MSTQDERILIHRLAAGELDALEGERARALIARDPELLELLEQLQDLQSRVQGAFPEPPSLGDRRAFAEMMSRLSGGRVEPTEQPRTIRPGAPQRMRPSSSAQIAEEIGDLGENVPVHAAKRVAFEDLEPPFAAAPSPGAHLFHLREIPREQGLPVELELYAGDALAIHSEVLLVSAFPGSFHPTPGSVFGAIRERYGFSFASGLPPGATRYSEGLLHFPGISCPAFDSLWVIELREPGQAFTVQDLRSALRAIGERLPDMLAGASSITLPLLGTGNQQLNPRDVARELLTVFPSWARNPRLRTIRVFTLALEHVAVLNRALDDRDFSRVVDSSFAAACQALRSSLERRDWSGSEPVRVALKELLQIASAPAPSMQSIALEGRRIGEIVLRMLSREVEAGAQRSLFEADSDALASRKAERAAPNLQLLLTHGRAAAAGEAVAPHDAVMVVYAAMQVAEMVGQSRGGGVTHT